MIRPPFAARVALGLVVVVVDEARRLPSTAVSLPMTAVSQVLQNAMRFQQTITELAIKGDEVISLISSSAEESPSWATFDDDDAVTSGKSEATLRPVPSRFDSIDDADLDNTDLGNTALDGAGTSDTEPADSGAGPAPAPVKKAAARKASASNAAAASTEGAAGRFALYSTPPEAPAPAPARKRKAKAKPPEIAEYLDYDSLTLAQLRARLRTLSLEELTTLLAYEDASSARAPFQTMLANRITTARAK